MEIRFPNGEKIETIFTNANAKDNLIKTNNGKVKNELYKHLTARTWEFSNGEVFLEFFDYSGLIFRNKKDFQKCNQIKFQKDKIDFLKETVSYLHEENFDDAIEKSTKLNEVQINHSNEFKIFKTDNELYLIINFRLKNAYYHSSLKSIASNYEDILSYLYPNGQETFTEDFINGKLMLDLRYNQYDVNLEKYEMMLENHKLIIEKKEFVSIFDKSLDLYKSENGYFILIESLNNNDLYTGTARVFFSSEEVKNAKKLYLKVQNEKTPAPIHFYQELYDKYKLEFPNKTNELIRKLPKVMNIDAERLDFSSNSIKLLDEAIEWKHGSDDFWEVFFYPTFAYYEEYLILTKGGKWEMKIHKDYDYELYVPHIVLSNGDEGMNVMRFYKSLYEWSIDLEIAGMMFKWEK